ncbi:MAG: ABC transporter permease [Acidimicrobiales bacterium]
MDPEGVGVIVAGVSVSSIVNWFDDAQHWRGADGIPHRLVQHIDICAVSLLVGLAVALPIGIVLGHHRKGGLLAQNLANVGRAVPSLVILILAVPFLGIGARPAELALVALAIPPLLTNTYLGMAQVDDDVREAARGMGMTASQTIWRAELPLALPYIMAGLRTATFNVIATATLAAEIASGGLGQFISTGLEVNDSVEIVCGALLVVALALAAEVALATVQRAVVPVPLRQHRRTRTTPTDQLEDSSDATVHVPA